MAITTVEEIHEYLISKNIQTTQIEILTGGTGNFIWRIKTLESGNRIIKHAAPFIAVAWDVPFAVERMGFEVQALQTLPGLLQEDRSIHIPRLLFHDDEAKVIGLEDVGDKTLKDLYEDPRLDNKLVGRNLGTWFARFHLSASDGDLKHDFHNQTSKKMSAQSWLYEQLPSALESYGFDPALGERIYKHYGTSLLDDEETICHGDLNPTNILFREEDLENGKLAVIDWEMARIGNGVTDIGQFAAEAYCLDRFRGGRGLLQAFLSAYMAGRPLRKVDAIRVAVHFGTHIVFWPTIHVCFHLQQKRCKQNPG
jgi:5-methylthioribose kinase